MGYYSYKCIFHKNYLTFYFIITPFDAFKNTLHVEILWKMERLLLWSNAPFSIILSKVIKTFFSMLSKK